MSKLAQALHVENITNNTITNKCITFIKPINVVNSLYSETCMFHKV